MYTEGRVLSALWFPEVHYHFLGLWWYLSPGYCHSTILSDAEPPPHRLNHRCLLSVLQCRSLYGHWTFWLLTAFWVDLLAAGMAVLMWESGKVWVSQNIGLKIVVDISANIIICDQLPSSHWLCTGWMWPNVGAAVWRHPSLVVLGGCWLPCSFSQSEKRNGLECPARCCLVSLWLGSCPYSDT